MTQRLPGMMAITMALIIIGAMGNAVTQAEGGRQTKNNERRDTIKKEDVDVVPKNVNPEQNAVSVLDNIIDPKSTPFGKIFKVRRDYEGFDADSLRFQGLTEEDFVLVAEELGVEVATIKAVVQVETGNTMKGFWKPGVPVINFSQSNFNRNNIRHSSPGNAESKVPDGLKGYALQQWSQLTAARKKNEQAADLSAYWGMFQISGANYTRCGCNSIEEFVELMCSSELEQLELFAAFITNAGMVSDLRNKNWAAFSRKYNGAGYAKRGYHTRMAAAYKRIGAEEARLASLKEEEPDAGELPDEN